MRGLRGLCVSLSGSLRRGGASWIGPGGHKGHRSPTPLGGGVAIWLTTSAYWSLGHAGCAVLGPDESARAAGPPRRGGLRSASGSCIRILGLATVIMVMGLVDDLKNLDWRLRLGFSSRCAVVLAGDGIRVTLFGPFAHPAPGRAVTVLWIVGLTNAFNMLDNMDGLAASVGLIAAALFCGAQVAGGQPVRAGGPAGGGRGTRRVSWSTTTRPRGSSWGMPAATSWGSCSGALTVVGTFTRDERGGSYSPYGVLAPLLVMAVPLYDMTSVILIRLREGRSPFHGRSPAFLAPAGGPRA